MPASSDVAGDQAAGNAFARFEQARRTHAKCAARALVIREELDRMKCRKVKLLMMSKMNAGQRKAWLEDLTVKTDIPFSKAWNRKFADQMQDALPFEVRSMIYDNLLDDNMWDQYHHALQAMMAPHYLYADYMGIGTAEEIVEKLYRSDWFKEQTLHDIALNLHKLIHEDPFGTGFDPAAYITGLDRDELKSSFYHLLAVAGNEDFFDLEITFMQRNVRIDVLEEALETFNNVYQAFARTGVEMRIRWEYLSPTYGLHNHSRNLESFFCEPRQSWKRKMFNFLKEMIPCMESRHVHFLKEPSPTLSDRDFVHRMWDNDEKFHRNRL
ncbi:hypothetical protein E8E12_005939 [Didymella heteroderae]|uniref:Uncharacterized protein n=1 Tax=Didymella heteroderae TaxID=1769908 RepID=A0A9P4WL12_9PLEO|nr:hypothetical protein E8E12_005939 [Didymella heteroderae]